MCKAHTGKLPLCEMHCRINSPQRPWETPSSHRATAADGNRRQPTKNWASSVSCNTHCWRNEKCDNSSCTEYGPQQEFLPFQWFFHGKEGAVRVMFADSAWTNINCGRTKAKYIAVHAIAPFAKQKMLDEFGGNYSEYKWMKAPIITNVALSFGIIFILVIKGDLLTSRQWNLMHELTSMSSWRITPCESFRIIGVLIVSIDIDPSGTSYYSDSCSKKKNEQ